jgi:hypothetical protein
MEFMTFSEYLEQRNGGVRSAAESPSSSGGDDASAASETAQGNVAACPGMVDARGRNQCHVSERSMFRGVLRAVNPARPASPTNSSLLASPFRKRLKSQVIGR